MDANSIHERLRGRFAETVRDLVTENPDPYIVVDRNALRDVCTFLRDTPDLELDFLESIAGVDLGETLLVVYHLFSYKHRHAIALRVELSPDGLELPSVADIWPAANWHEREQYDLFGFTFTGHPDLRRIMLPEDWDGHPLRKGYQYPTAYHGIEHDRPSPGERLKAADAASPSGDKAPAKPAAGASGSKPTRSQQTEA